MCALMTPGLTFGVTESVTNTKLYNLVANGTVTNIVDADISAGAGIQFSKILATGIDASLFVGFPNAQAAAGKWPFANLPVPFGSTYVSLVSIPNSSLLPLTLASWVDGIALRNLASTPVDQQVRYNLIVSSIASGGYIGYSGSSSLIGVPAPSQALTLISSTTISGAAASGSISLITGNVYFVVYTMDTLSGNDSLAIRFNGDTGSNYSYINYGVSITTLRTNNAAGSAAGIILGEAIDSTPRTIQGSFYIQQTTASSQIYRIWGQSFQTTSTGIGFEGMSNGGQWGNSADITSMVFKTISGATMNGKIYLYKLAII